MIDLDGSFVFSNVTSIKVPESELISILNYYPNPTIEKLNVEFFIKKSRTGTAKIINSFGQIVLEKNMEWEKGENLIYFDVEQIDAGFYFILLEVDELYTKQIPIVIQRN